VAAPPEGYRVINIRHADGASSSIDGCIGTAPIDLWQRTGHWPVLWNLAAVT
jgi:hypothetical protein